jgi:hypothetical protein
VGHKYQLDLAWIVNTKIDCLTLSSIFSHLHPSLIFAGKAEACPCGKHKPVSLNLD